MAADATTGAGQAAADSGAARQCRRLPRVELLLRPRPRRILQALLQLRPMSHRLRPPRSSHPRHQRHMRSRPTHRSHTRRPRLPSRHTLSRTRSSMRSRMHSSTRNHTARNRTARNRTVRNRTVRNRIARSRTVRSRTVRNRTARSRTVRSRTLRNRIARSRTVRSRTVRNRIARSRTARSPTVRNRIAHSLTVRSRTRSRTRMQHRRYLLGGHPRREAGRAERPLQSHPPTVPELLRTSMARATRERQRCHMLPPMGMAVGKRMREGDAMRGATLGPPRWVGARE